MNLNSLNNFQDVELRKIYSPNRAHLIDHDPSDLPAIIVMATILWVVHGFVGHYDIPPLTGDPVISDVAVSAVVNAGPGDAF